MKVDNEGWNSRSALFGKPSVKFMVYPGIAKLKMRASHGTIQTRQLKLIYDSCMRLHVPILILDNQLFRNDDAPIVIV